MWPNSLHTMQYIESLCHISSYSLLIPYLWIAWNTWHSGLPLPHYSRHLWLFWAILGRHALDAVCLECVILFVNVTLFNDAVMSYMTSQCHMCIGHVAKGCQYLGGGDSCL